jgi:hypothetical protein
MSPRLTQEYTRIYASRTIDLELSKISQHDYDAVVLDGTSQLAYCFCDVTEL